MPTERGIGLNKPEQLFPAPGSPCQHDHEQLIGSGSGWTLLLQKAACHTDRIYGPLGVAVAQGQSRGLLRLMESNTDLRQRGHLGLPASSALVPLPAGAQCGLMRLLIVVSHAIHRPTSQTWHSGS
jgi:hypothetical protein